MSGSWKCERNWTDWKMYVETSRTGFVQVGMFSLAGRFVSLILKPPWEASHHPCRPWSFNPEKPGCTFLCRWQRWLCFLAFSGRPTARPCRRSGAGSYSSASVWSSTWRRTALTLRYGAVAVSAGGTAASAELQGAFPWCHVGMRVCYGWGGRKPKCLHCSIEGLYVL